MGRAGLWFLFCGFGGFLGLFGVVCCCLGLFVVFCCLLGLVGLRGLRLFFVCVVVFGLHLVCFAVLPCGGV